ncbi:hypothetical protein SDC9_146396 [bioreactor metagenome]|uniref:DUF503 domain-containing protein n=1 Tax=bioreactor metagenome TaxID=1076179 RepID=A0A645ECJ4_9ZZZZ
MLTLLTLKMFLPGCGSLKEKRGRLQPILKRIHKEFNLSVSEIGLQDVWQSAWLGFAVVSNDAVHNQQVLQSVINFIELNWPDERVTETHIEAR